MRYSQTRLLVLFTLALTFIVSLLFLIDFSPFLRGPGVYPPNWRWPYEFSFAFPQILLPLLILTLIISLVFIRRIQKNEKLFLFILISLGFLLQISLLFYSRAGIGVIFHRIINENINGYFTASLSINSIPKFLNGFNESLVNLPMYAKFHPPFAVLFFDLLNRISMLLVNLFPFTSSINPTHQDVLNVWEGLKNYQRLTVLYSGFLISVLSLVTVIPIYLVTKLLYGNEAANKSAYLFVLSPAILLFVPISDILFPIFGVISFYFFAKGIKESNSFYYFISGLILCIGVYFTLTFIPFVLFFGIYYLFLKGFKINRKDINNGLFFSVGLILIPVILLLFGNNFIEMLLRIMHFHEEAQHYRPYSIWVFYNLYDFFLFVGLPTAIVFICSLVLTFTKKTRKDLLLISFLVFLMILNFSGSVRAETGRIWIPMIPFLIIPVAGFLSKINISEKMFGLILIALGIQIIIFQTVLITLY